MDLHVGHPTDKNRNIENGTITSSLSVALHKRQGNFFAYAMFPLIFLSSVSGCWHLFTYTRTKDWYRNSAALDLGFIHPKEEETAWTSLALDIHAFLGIMSGFTLIVQVFTGIKLHRSNPSSQPEQLVTRHRLIGRVIVVLWTIACFTGAVFLSVSKRYKNATRNIVTRFGIAGIFFWSIGIGSLVNMYLGVQAVRRQAERPLNLTRHKGLIFFGLFWILGAAMDELIMSTAQIIIHDCFLDNAFVGFLAGGQIVQILAITIGAFFYERTLFQFPFVKINLACLTLRALLISSLFVSMVANNQMFIKDKDGSSVDREESCFAP